MTVLEWENFRALDERKYILEENKEFLKYYLRMHKQGFKSIIDIYHIQRLINEIVEFYEVKYPNKLLSELEYSCNISDDSLEAIKISRMFDMKQLKFRLPHDYNQFLECSYEGLVRLQKPKKNLADPNDLEQYYVEIGTGGFVNDYAVKILQKYHFLDDASGINCADDLLNRFASIETEVNYSELKKWVDGYNYDVSLRNWVLKLIPLAMLYSKTTRPEYGYVRAKSFVRTFNKEYNLKLDLEELDFIMSRDYSKSNKEKVLEKVLNRYKEK